MAERILFLTGHLARPRLEKVLARIDDTGFESWIFDVGVKVAALMTEAIISRRVPRPVQADRIVVPGRCRANLDRLSADFGVKFERGPEELKDLPAYFGKHGRGLDLSRHDMRIFAEIVDASALTVDAILARAIAMQRLDRLPYYGTIHDLFAALRDPDGRIAGDQCWDESGLS